jgi:hypothetical protein
MVAVGGNNSELAISLSGTGSKLRLTIRDNSGLGYTTDTINIITLGKWHHAAGIFFSDTDRTVILDGSLANKGVGTTSAPVSGMNTTRLGSNGRFPGNYWDGLLFWGFIWEVALSEQQVVRLAQGTRPWEIEPQGIVFGPNSFTLYDTYSRSRLTSTGTTLDVPAPVRRFLPTKRYFIASSTTPSLIQPLSVVGSISPSQAAVQGIFSPFGVATNIDSVWSSNVATIKPTLVGLSLGVIKPGSLDSLEVFIKHVDFEIPNWKEFFQGPQNNYLSFRPARFRPSEYRPAKFRPAQGSPSAFLSQSSEAAFPDRPVSGGMGMTISMVSGTDGTYLEYSSSDEIYLLHTRFVLGHGTSSGGNLNLLKGLNETGNETFRVTYHCTTRTLVVNLPNNLSLSTMLNSQFPWHCIELKVDVLSGQADLWINGISRSTVVGPLGTLGTKRLWMGGISKDVETTGNLYLDEWIISNEYIGPVITKPVSDYADDPARWLVVYNTADTSSVTWAEYYRSSRRIPFANLAGFNLNTTEIVNESEYLFFRDVLIDYLKRNRLNEQILGLLLGYRVPAYVDLGGNGVLDSIPALLFDLGVQPKANPLAGNHLPERPKTSNLQGLRLTARIDAAELSGAQVLSTRADSLLANGIGNGDSARIMLDPYTTVGSSSIPVTNSMVEWANGIDRMRTRLPLELSSPTDPDEDVEFTTLFNDGFFWGWSSATPTLGFFGLPAGHRIFCFQLNTAQATCPTLRSLVASNWVETAIDSGYAAAAGSSRSYSISAIPYIRPFFEALRLGWTLAEAWFVSIPLPGEGLFLVGDPLLTVSFPKAGWDLYGPLESLERLIPESPDISLKEVDRSVALPSSLRPNDNQSSLYLIRHIDERGQTEAGSKVISTVNNNGTADHPPLMPCWPDNDTWPLLVEDGLVKPFILWDQSIHNCHISILELLGMTDDGNTEVLAIVDIQPLERFFQVNIPIPSANTCYWWRMSNSNGVNIETTRSQIIYRPQESLIVLQFVGVKP